jgi:hypothetical protein
MRLIWLGVAAAMLAGCAGYRLGPTNRMAAGSRSIQVNPFQNQTMQPRLAEALVQALRKNLQRDGTYRLATQNDGDVIVTGVIVEYLRSPVSYEPGDVLTVRDYDISLVARMVAVERGASKPMVDSEFRGRTTVRVGNDQTSAERQALPLLAEDWARHATGALADGDW